VHPLLRLLPPRALDRLAPAHVLCGHGEGIHGADAGCLFHEALRDSRRGIPRWLGGLARETYGSVRRRARAGLRGHGARPRE
jgi:hypothetical protein